MWQAITGINVDQNPSRCIVSLGHKNQLVNVKMSQLTPVTNYKHNAFIEILLLV